MKTESANVELGAQLKEDLGRGAHLAELHPAQLLVVADGTLPATERTASATEPPAATVPPHEEDDLWRKAQIQRTIQKQMALVASKKEFQELARKQWVDQEIARSTRPETNSPNESSFAPVQRKRTDQLEELTREEAQLSS